MARVRNSSGRGCLGHSAVRFRFLPKSKQDQQAGTNYDNHADGAALAVIWRDEQGCSADGWPSENSKTNGSLMKTTVFTFRLADMH